MDALGATVLVVALAWALARWAVPALRRRGLDRVVVGVVGLGVVALLWRGWPGEATSWWGAAVASALISVVGIGASALGWQGAQRAVGVERTAGACIAAVVTGRAVGLGLPSTLGLDAWTLADGIAAGGPRAVAAKLMEKLVGVTAAGLVWPLALWVAADALSDHPQIAELEGMVAKLCLGAVLLTVGLGGVAAWMSGRHGLRGWGMLVAFKLLSHLLAVAGVWTRVALLYGTGTFVEAAGTLLGMLAGPMGLAAGPSLTGGLGPAQQGAVHAAAFVGMEVWTLSSPILLHRRLGSWPARGGEDLQRLEHHIEHIESN